MVFWIFYEIHYASRVIEVAQQQQVVDSGAYAHVRYPMYAGSIVLYLFSPLALRSWWAMMPALSIIPILVMRILNEEDVLLCELSGYTAFRLKVCYHLFPGVW